MLDVKPGAEVAVVKMTGIVVSGTFSIVLEDTFGTPAVLLCSIVLDDTPGVKVAVEAPGTVVSEILIVLEDIPGTPAVLVETTGAEVAVEEIPGTVVSGTFSLVLEETAVAPGVF